MGVIETNTNLALLVAGSVVWIFGMVLGMAPIVMFPRRGGVAKGQPFVRTTRLVDIGIYAVVRHPQYTSGFFSIFLTTLLWFPHWLFGLLGAIGVMVIHMGCREEDQRLIQQFGDDYREYMKKVPRMNIFLGAIRRMQRKSGL